MTTTTGKAPRRQRKATKATAPAASPYVCSFCGKGPRDVKKLLAGPHPTYICDECVRLCVDVLASELVDDKPAWLGYEEARRFGTKDAQRSAAYRVEIVELRATLELERAQRAATSPGVTWEAGYMAGWRRGRRAEGYVDPNPYLDDTGPRAVARRTPTALLGEPDAPR